MDCRYYLLRQSGKSPSELTVLTNADYEVSPRGSKVIAVTLSNSNPVLAKDAFVIPPVIQIEQKRGILAHFLEKSKIITPPIIFPCSSFTQSLALHPPFDQRSEASWQTLFGGHMKTNTGLRRNKPGMCSQWDTGSTQHGKVLFKL